MENPVSTRPVSRAARSATALALVALFAMLLSPMAARADNVQNDVVAGGNGTFTAGGSTTISYRINGTNGDGETGCNATVVSPATVSVNTPGVVSTSPDPITMTACNTNYPVVFASSTPGDYLITVSVADSGPGTYNVNPATFTLRVLAPADSTAPGITPNVVGTLGANGWYVGNVDLSWTVVDNESAVSTSSGCGLVSIVADQGATTYTCSATSAGGTNSQSVTIMRDATAPTISGSAAPLPNGAGWNNTGVSVTFTCGDNLSGVVSCGPNTDLSSDGVGLSVSGTATDAAGNTAGATVSNINIDATNPVVEASTAPAANGNGWRNTDVTVSFTCSDTGGSGIVSCSPAQTLGEGPNQSATGTATDVAGNTGSVTVTNINVDKTAPTISGSQTPAANADGWNNGPVAVAFTCGDALSSIDTCVGNTTLSAEGAGQSAGGTATDKAGNTATATVSGIKIDLTDPTNVQFTGTTLSDGGTYYFGSVPGAPSGCTADDALSGIKSCSVGAGYGTSVGPHSLTATATDKAGNTATATFSYTVLNWTTGGFYQPVDMGGVVNTVKGGSTVPLKFEVFAGSTELTSTSVVKSFVQTKVACSTGAAIDEIEVTTTGGTSLRYDATGGQFVQNWQTPKAAGTCYAVTVTMQDGSQLTAKFQLK